METKHRYSKPTALLQNQRHVGNLRILCYINFKFNCIFLTLFIFYFICPELMNSLYCHSYKCRNVSKKYLQFQLKWTISNSNIFVCLYFYAQRIVSLAAC